MLPWHVLIILVLLFLTRKSLTEKYDFSRSGHAVSALPWSIQRLACIQSFVLVKVAFFWMACVRVCYFVKSWKSNNTVLHARLYACHKSSPSCICMQKDHMCMLSILKSVSEFGLWKHLSPKTIQHGQKLSSVYRSRTPVAEELGLLC